MRASPTPRTSPVRPEAKGGSEPSGSVVPERPAFLRAPPWLVAVVPGVALAALAWVLLAGLDQPLFFLFNGLPRLTGPALWAHITILGDGLVCAVLLLCWVRRHPERIWGGVLGALIMIAMLHGLRMSLEIPRPLGVLPADMVEVIGPRHRLGALPSGHAAMVFLYAGVWALSLRRRAFSQRWRAFSLRQRAFSFCQRALPLVLITPPLIVSISRIVVGIHWPSDVLAGAALGWTSAWLGLLWAGRFRWGLAPPGRWILAGALLICAVVLLFVDHTGYPGILPFQRTLALVCLAWGTLALVRDLREFPGVTGEKRATSPHSRSGGP